MRDDCRGTHVDATVNTVFTRISDAGLIKFLDPQMRRLIEGGFYLKIGRYKEMF